VRGGAATPITDPVGKVRTGLAVSLDGFIGGPNDGAEAPMRVGGERETAKPPGRWMSTLEAGRVSPRPPRVVVDCAVVESDAKTPKGRRPLALDPVTLAALKALHDPSLDEQAAETVARLILGDGEVITDLSANKPLATGPRCRLSGEGGEAQKSCSGGVSEGGLEPPRPMRALGPQPSASAYSATPTWCTWVRADCSKGATRRRGQAGRLTVDRSRVPQGVRLKPCGPGVRTAAWCSVKRGVTGRSARMAASAWW
jgi:hypothetical protein